ncbi:MAG: carboxypeptidase regulatory-like domain-containing protein, partial [Planctomycetota bacterium]
LEPWLAGLLTNVARNARRDARRRRADAIPELGGDAIDPADAAARGEVVAWLRTHVDALPTEQRQALLLQLQHGMSPAEIAEVLAIPPGTVRMRIHRGLEALRRRAPAGLAAFALPPGAPRGLDAVREAVLRAGAARPVPGAPTPATPLAAAGTVSLIGGSLVTNKLLCALAVLLCCGLLWQTLGTPADPTPPIAATAGGGGPADAARAAEATRARDAAVRHAADAPRVATTGTLVIRTLASTAEGHELPLPGTQIVVWRGGDPLQPFDDGAAHFVADDDGLVQLTDLAPGRWHVSMPVEHTDGRPAQVESGAVTEVRLVRPAVQVLRGQVVDADGAPVAGADLWLMRGTAMGRYSLPEPAELVSRRAGRSGADGRFAIATADPRESRVAASCSGHADSRARFVNGRGADVRLVLGRVAAGIDGVVRDATGAPVAGAVVTVTPSEQDSRRDADGTLLAGRVPRHRRTDADGRFRFEGLAPGRARVGASAWPHCPDGVEVELRAGEDAAVALDLPAGVGVRGSVRTAAGAPMLAMVESRRSRDEDGHWSQCGTRPDGSFWLPYQPQQTFTVVALVAGRVAASREFVDPPAGPLVCDLVVDALLLRGRVVDPTGRGLDDWRVTAVAADGGATTAETNADGSFRLRPPAGTLRTVAAAPPEAPDAPAIAIDGIGVGGPLELVVPAHRLPSGTIRGRVVRGDGAPFDARTLTLTHRDSDHHRTARTDANGDFAFAGLSGGTFALTCRVGGYEQPLGAPVPLDAGRAHDCGTIALPATGALVAELVHADGRPWRGDPPGLRLWDAAGLEVACEHTFAAGDLRVRAVPGAYRVTVNATDLLAPDLTVTLAAGTETALRVPLTIGRTRTLTFNGDGQDHPERDTPLQVTVRATDGTVAAECTVTALRADLRGFRYWGMRQVFAFGRYDVEATRDGMVRYRGAFECGPDLDAPSTVDIPRAD